MKRQSYPLYQEAVTAYLEGQTRRLNQLKKDPELSMNEKGLLQVRLSLKASMYDRAIEQLERIGQGTKGFLLAEKEFLLANAYAYQGFWQKALLANQKALLIYSQLNDHRGLFLTHHNIATDYQRLNLMECSSDHFEQALFYAKSENEKYLALRGMACNQNRQGQVEEAVRLIESCLLHSDHLNKVDQGTLYLMAADILFRSGRKERTRELIDKAYSIKGQRERPRTLFYKQLIEKLDSGDLTLKRPPEGVKSSQEYYLKWIMLRNIQFGEVQLAEKKWQKLALLFPNIFDGQNSFKCKTRVDDESLFMTFLKKCLTQSQVISSQAKQQMTTKMRKLYESLSQSKMPLRKEDLIEKIWLTEYSPQYDARFYKLIERTKKRTDFSIQNKNQCYSLSLDI